MVILQFARGERENTVGVFDSRENAVEFLKSIPFVHRESTEWGDEYTIDYTSMPDCYAACYRGKKYPLSRFSFALGSGDSVQALLIDVCRMDDLSGAEYVDGATPVDAYVYENCDVEGAIRAREHLAAEAKEYCRLNGLQFLRDGSGSQDGEYVAAYKSDPADAVFFIHLDPYALCEREKAGSFAALLGPQ